MSESRVTREMVQELAETGAVQLAGVEFPAIRPNHSQKLDRLVNDKTFGVIGEAAWSIIAQSGLMDCTPMVDLKIFPTLRRVEMHQDRGGHMEGFTMLWDPSAKDDSALLKTYGRGITPNHASPRIFDYSKGPIVLAQKAFGTNLLEFDSDYGGCWHSAERIGFASMNMAYVDFLHLFDSE